MPKSKFDINKDLKVTSLVLISDEQIDVLPVYNFLLQKNLIASLGLLKPESILSPQYINLLTDNYTFLVEKNRIQFISFEPQYSQTFIDAIYRPALDFLNPSILKAFGVNFHWFLNDKFGHSIELLTKSLFNNNKPLNTFFNSDDTKYGAYFSKNLTNKIRLKLDIKPVVLNLKGDNSEYIEFMFNFHNELSNISQSVQLCLETIDQYQFFLNETINILSLIENE